MRLNLTSWLTGVLLCGVIGYHFRDAPWPPERIAGAVVCVVAFVFVSLARYQLGRAFSLNAQASHLVTYGLYAKIRNPIYVFAELFLVGFSLFVMRWWPVALAVTAIPLQWVRARREAAVLESAFGEEYLAYRRKTWF